MTHSPAISSQNRLQRHCPNKSAGRQLTDIQRISQLKWAVPTWANLHLNLLLCQASPRLPDVKKRK